jgi:hypothetical protein
MLGSLHGARSLLTVNHNNRFKGAHFRNVVELVNKL